MKKAQKRSVFWIALSSLLILAIASIIPACGGGGGGGGSTTSDDNDNETTNNGTSTPTTDTSTTFTLTSSAISNGELLATYKCEEKVNGTEKSIPLSWSNVPASTESLVVIMHHFPNSNDTSNVNSYLLLWNIDPSVTEIAHGGADDGNWYMGSNKDGDAVSYTSPCSQDEGTREYTITLYALSQTPATLPTESTVDVTYDVLVNAIETVTVIEKATLTFNDVTGTSDTATDVDLDRCTQIKASITDAGFDPTVTCDSNYAYIVSDTYPDHDLMNGITGTNEQIPVPAVDYSSPIKLSPEKASNVTTIDAALGVAVNGVPIYDYSAQGTIDVTTYDESTDTTLLGQLDNCGGHAGRGDDYHYHAAPTCMIDSMANKGDSAILGWGFDGYPLYGNNNPDGTTINSGDLDNCNGQEDSTFGYRYHTSSTQPYVWKCLVGTIDETILPRVAPLKDKPTGVPPEGGVTNLVHSHNKTTGERSLTYQYNGESYFIRYTPSSSGDSCYDFVMNTVTHGEDTATYCRE